MTARTLIDAGAVFLRVLRRDGDAVLSDTLRPVSGGLRRILEETIPSAPGEVRLAGRLAPAVRRVVGTGALFPAGALLWEAARRHAAGVAAAVVEISASGYALAGVGPDGALRDDLLSTHPRCGAGSGLNLDRVLQKLAIPRERVDEVLASYLGEPGTPAARARARLAVRADRCGVFGSSATVSDKNQGIPLPVALGVTLKSEVAKACARLPAGFARVVFVGRVFRWRFAREVAADLVGAKGPCEVSFDPEGDVLLDALNALPPELATPLPPPFSADERPAFAALRDRLAAAGRYRRLPPDRAPPDGDLVRPLHLGLDVGSTMAKAVLQRDDGSLARVLSFSNCGDTIDTVKALFGRLAEEAGVLHLRSVGVTGSARFQVREILARTWPELAPRISVLVENYAHAHGSIAEIRARVRELVATGEPVNETLGLLVDIGGEDTKISVLALDEAELFANAMNLKCSAGTGSLMDSLAVSLGLPGPAEASAEAMTAARSLSINATCAVFLMDGARRLQAEGYPRPEILASAAWAVVDNMARSLWTQIELPRRPVVLLHGQTMLSDPLPVATAERLQSACDGAWCVVPAYPGHRACFGLIDRARRAVPAGDVGVELGRLLASRHQRKVFSCHGAVCGDSSAVCNRALLTCRDAAGEEFSFTLGGCGAVNELMARKLAREAAAPAAMPRDLYKEARDMVAARLPRSDRPDRWVLPRDFCISEWAFFLAGALERLGVPVHVDDPTAADVLYGASALRVDTCAPQIGAVGHFERLAGEPHGAILVPQIEFLPTGGASLGRACTINQGGPAVAMNLARVRHPDANFCLFKLDLSVLDPARVAAEFVEGLAPLFGPAGPGGVPRPALAAAARAVEEARDAHLALRRDLADLAAAVMREEAAAGRRVALVVGREYLLNPGVYDSHVPRLLRDKGMAALPSWVLDVDPAPEYAHIYWRNPHVLTTIIDAVARRDLHRRIRHDALAEAFRAIETGSSLLPVVQVSTFACGPDSVMNPLVAEIMKRRPFLTIQSDAAIQELAHLENRVNTYVRQLELRLHDRLPAAQAGAFEIASLKSLEHGGRIDRDRDILYLPSLGDLRPIAAVLRAAGFACVDPPADPALESLIREGREAAGPSVCAPLAGVYADLGRAIADFERRRAVDDPLVRGRTRLLFLNNKGDGPCRQGQYVEVHKLLARQEGVAIPGERDLDSACGGGSVQFLVANEVNGYDIGLEPWTLLRLYQAGVLQGLLVSLLSLGARVCRDAGEHARYAADHACLKEEICSRLERWRGPSRLARGFVWTTRPLSPLHDVARFFAYRLGAHDLAPPLRAFARRWNIAEVLSRPAPLRIIATGEAYMRAALAEELRRRLIDHLGFGRFSFDTTPVWCYAEYLIEYEWMLADERRARAAAADDATGAAAAMQVCARMDGLRDVLRNRIAAPLYRAAGLPLPHPVRELMRKAATVLPTMRPTGELAPYLGEALHALSDGTRLVFNVAPGGCMVATMGEALTPALRRAAGDPEGWIQPLFSADGEIDDDLFELALLKARFRPRPAATPCWSWL